MKGVAILSFLAVLVAANAGVVPEKQTVTIHEIYQLLSKSLDKAHKSWKDSSPLVFPPIMTLMSLTHKSDDFDLTWNLSNVIVHAGDLESKSVSARLNDSAVSGEVGFILRGYKIVGKHATNGTIRGKAYELTGDVEITYNFRRKISFVASYDNKSVTLEEMDMRTHISNMNFHLTGLPFDEDTQKEIISRLSDEYLKINSDGPRSIPEILGEALAKSIVTQYFNEKFKGQTLQDIYNTAKDMSEEEVATLITIKTM